MSSLHKLKVGNKHLFSSKRVLYIALALASALLLATGIWRSGIVRTSLANKQNEPARQRLIEKIRAGLGTDIRFASPKNPSEKIHESVTLTDKFIYERSGLKMSQQTKERLIAMEDRTLNGGSPLVSVGDLIDALTETALERLSTITDQEITDATKILQADRGVIFARSSGGRYATAEEFVGYARTARNLCVTNRTAIREIIRPTIEGEVKDRVALFSEALPKHFSRASEDGITPLQCLVITYSVVADDLLSGSQSDLRTEMDRAYQAAGNGTSNGPKPDKAFGVNGYLFPTPLNLAINQKTMHSLLDRIEKGETK